MLVKQKTKIVVVIFATTEASLWVGTEDISAKICGFLGGILAKNVWAFGCYFAVCD